MNNLGLSKDSRKTLQPKESNDPLGTSDDSASTQSSERHLVKTNTYGEVKTQRWNRPKKELPMKDFEKVPTRRSQRISDKNKDKAKVHKSSIGDFLILLQ